MDTIQASILDLGENPKQLLSYLTKNLLCFSLQPIIPGFIFNLHVLQIIYKPTVAFDVPPGLHNEIPE